MDPWNVIKMYVCMYVYVTIKTLNTRNILNFENSNSFVMATCFGTRYHPQAIFVMPTRIKSGLKPRIKLLH
jgi:hypothetical protein